MSTSSRPAARKGTRVRTYSTRRNEEEDRAERAEQLKRSKAGLIRVLRKMHEEIANLRIERGDIWSEDLEVKLAVYEETWRTFVKTHECFMELTEPGFKRNGAQTMYGEEFAKKMELDEIVKQMRVVCGSKSIEGSMSSRERKSAKNVSTEISCNSVYSGFDARREKMILSKLKVEHLKKRQELQLRLTELNHARELMEAKMEAEKAYVSFSILGSESGAGAIDHETPRLILKKTV